MKKDALKGVHNTMEETGKRNTGEMKSFSKEIYK